MYHPARPAHRSRHDQDDAQTLEPIAYTLRFQDPHTHHVDVEAAYPTGGQAEVELMMAVWTPGSDLVREYSPHVEELTAWRGDARLPVVKTRKNRWRITAGGAPSVTVRYRVYAR
jgi:predicted metalloprotease with PDZ domain